LKKERNNTSQFVDSGGDLLLDGDACVDILRATLAKRASLRLQVKGFSMTPFVRNGDVVTLSPISGDKVGVGRVVAFLRACDRKLVIHRLVGVLQGPEERYIPKGDNLSGPDDPISRADMLASVEKVERGGKVLSLGMGPERGLIAYLSRINFFCGLSLFKSWLFFPLRQKILRQQ